MPTPKPTAEQIEQFKQKYPRAEVFEAEEYDATFVLRGANRAEYELFRRAAQRGDKFAILGIENLVRACVLFPDRAALDTLGEELPAIFDSLGEKVLALSGMTKSIEKKSV